MCATDLLTNADVPFAKWLENDVEQEEASGNHAWCAGRTPSEIRRLSFVEDTVFGTLWDAQLKLVVEAGTLPAGALSQGALAEYLAAIGVLQCVEQAAAAKAASGHATESHADPVDDSTALAVEVETHPSSLQRARPNLVLLSKDNIAQLAHTAMGQLRGSIDVLHRDAASMWASSLPCSVPSEAVAAAHGGRRGRGVCR